MADKAIIARSVRRSYGRTLVLKGVDFDLETGRMLCLAGPNGAGKTTLLHLLATLLRPQHGSLTVLGEALPDGRDAVRRRLGLIAHASFLYPQLTLRENLQFYAGMYSLGNAPARIAALSADLAMADWLDRPVGTLSRGLLQRGTWMRALLHEPELLLLDEPFTGLDSTSLEALLALVRTWRQSGKTVVLTSHELARDLPLCDDVMVLRDGRVETRASGTRILRPVNALSQMWAIARKDVQLELRSRGMLSALGVFALGTLLVFAFAFELEKIRPARLIPGVLWVTVLFSAMLALNRMFTLEERHDAFWGLLLTPIDRAVIFGGKLLGGLFFVMSLQLVTILLLFLWFSLPPANLLGVAGLALIGDVGLVSSGTLLASMAFRTRAREAVLPALLLPVAFPWLLCGVKATAAVLEGDAWADYQTWVTVMVVFDIIFLTAGWLLFESAVED